MDPFATAAQLATRMKTTFDQATEAAAVQQLTTVSDTFRDLTGQTVWPKVASATRTWQGARGPVLWLPHPPAIPVDIVTVTVNGETLDEDAWRLDMYHGLHLTSTGGWNGIVEVVYDHGFDDPPGSIVQLVLDIVQRRMANPVGATQETAGPFSQSFGPAAAQGWRPDELKIADRYTCIVQ